MAVPAAPSGARTRPVAPHRLPRKRPMSPPPLLEAGEDAMLPEIHASEITLGEIIGQGSTAEVYSAHWNGKNVVVKAIVTLGARQASAQVHFAREVSILAKVRHPNLVQSFGICVGIAGSSLAVISEYCFGGTLFELLHNEDVALSWKQNLKMCEDVAAAMEYLHNFKPQIIHRDLKSLNLFLAGAVSSSEAVPLVKVADFGLARMKDLDAEWERMTTSVGTYHWMAPEVVTGEYDTKADVYSFSMVMYEVICRRVPFEEEDDVVARMCSGERPTLSDVPAQCPTDLRSIMTSTWMQNPDERPEFSSIRKMLAEVKLSTSSTAAKVSI
eukprot:CAMPEP_0197654338 /NCGR_PEP_ID=MMETSP1338-20131121/38795_1 /TAXON_ID=43686 ORGANISM="Pelagodinium beii, Strain RCC1491" /NCGR_SAMPLE_ID=MMETSP1338 /ASSEMBLY_ACC=CAM_ASM_000754 /LENGTH=327 /DNA_ID=CAMNT_0043229773 /DNA_START=22 /DNA_END=1005 /DNA_ORIENTATION=+